LAIASQNKVILGNIKICMQNMYCKSNSFFLLTSYRNENIDGQDQGEIIRNNTTTFGKIRISCWIL